eukprot:IDg7250t1
MWGVISRDIDDRAASRFQSNRAFLFQGKCGFAIESTHARDVADADNAADAYFERIMLQCTREQSCRFDGALAASRSCFAMNESDRVETVR